MNIPRPADIEDKNPNFTKEMKGPFNGQGKFLNELPTIIELLRWNLREIEDESKIWDVAEWGPFGNRLEEWITSHNFIKYKSKYREAEGALSNLQNELLKGKSTIGFVGAPWTLLVYILNKKSPKKELRKDFFKDQFLINRILDLLDKFLKSMVKLTFET